MPAEPLERVVVVGNGPVGQSAALLLARWGIPVLLLDRKPRREQVGSRSICQQRDVLDIWAAVGVGDRIAAEGVTWTTARTFHRDRELFSYRVADPGEARFPPFVNISQSRTEQLLDERIATEPLITVRWGSCVEDVRQDAHGATVQWRTDAGRSVVRAPYVVVCAGGHADALREQLGVTFDGAGFADRFLICDIRTDLPGWAQERRFYFDPVWNPGRQVLIHPCPDSTFRVDWQVPPDFDVDAEEASGGLHRRIRAIVGDRPYEVVWRSVYQFSSRIASRFAVGRVLLAGDCAHLVAPFGARGLNTGVADAENAAWKLAFVLRGWAPPALLETFHDERHAAARENLAVTTATMDFLVPQTAAARAWRRDVLERAGDDAATRAHVDSGRLAEPYWYPCSPLITPDPTRPRADRPRRGETQRPAPGVIVPDVPLRLPGRAGRTRDVARSGFALFGTDGADLDAALAAAREATAAPVSGFRCSEVDPSGRLHGALGARPREVWLIRPDAHVAAVLTAPRASDVRAAVRRSSALSGSSEPEAAHPCTGAPPG